MEDSGLFYFTMFTTILYSIVISLRLAIAQVEKVRVSYRIAFCLIATVLVGVGASLAEVSRLSMRNKLHTYDPYSNISNGLLASGMLGAIIILLCLVLYLLNLSGSNKGKRRS